MYKLSITRHTELSSIDQLLQLIRSGEHLPTAEVEDSTQAVIRIAPLPFATGKNRVVSAHGPRVVSAQQAGHLAVCFECKVLA